MKVRGANNTIAVALASAESISDVFAIMKAVRITSVRCGLIADFHTCMINNSIDREKIKVQDVR